MFKLLFLLQFLLFSCQKEEGQKPVEHSYSEELKEKITNKFNTLYQLHLEKRDSNGFVLTHECDSLLFSGLISAVDKTNRVNISAARDVNGKWSRRPLNYAPCYPESSKSSISRDMFVGLFWHIWRNKDLKMAEELYAYGTANNWIMGDGDLSRTYLTPSMQGNLAELIFRLGGKDRVVERNLPQVYDKNLNGFEAHLLSLTALLRAEMSGEIENDSLMAVKGQLDRNPKNALFSYIYHKYSDGLQDETIELLLNEKHWPSDRLPTNRDRKAEWLPQRDGGSDYEPELSGDEKKHDGSDFVFMFLLMFADK